MQPKNDLADWSAWILNKGNLIINIGMTLCLTGLNINIQFSTNRYLERKTANFLKLSA